MIELTPRAKTQDLLKQIKTLRTDLQNRQSLGPATRDDIDTELRYAENRIAKAIQCCPKPQIPKKKRAAGFKARADALVMSTVELLRDLETAHMPPTLVASLERACTPLRFTAETLAPEPPPPTGWLICPAWNKAHMFNEGVGLCHRGFLVTPDLVPVAPASTAVCRDCVVVLSEAYRGTP